MSREHDAIEPDDQRQEQAEHDLLAGAVAVAPQLRGVAVVRRHDADHTAEHDAEQEAASRVGARPAQQQRRREQQGQQRTVLRYAPASIRGVANFGNDE